MATALDILKRSLRLLGVYSLGENPSAEEVADGITSFNALVGTLSNTGMVYVKTLDTINLSASQSSVTVGPSGSTVTARPVKVLDESYIEFQSVTYPLSVLSLQEYNDISVKSNQGIPIGIWPLMEMPDITLTFYPVPSEAMTLKLWSAKPLSSTLTQTTQLVFPPGYEDAFAYLLADAIAPEYEVGISDAVQRGITRSRRLMKRANFQQPLQRLDLPAGIYGGFTWRDGV